ncbi:hypothetical protein K466DRAFT_606415 [Polyporus arcularius HHB13444]|uniref:Acid protease n=1 Tax=Polyporus arcularius HHB13444 TaxID=1314778 RepID=A0A5C3NN32_9APHY|nr:hypothetical protein K466DRAFT_606415 [Polyporus arcularius HHB13444]
MFASVARVALVAALAVSAFAAPDVGNPTRTARDVAAPVNPVGVVTRSLAHNPVVPLTNAQRLSRGLPPNRPRAHRRRALQARQSSTCVAQRGTIRVTLTDSATGAVVNNGYVAANANSFGEYGFTPVAAEAISVSICPESSTFDILALNGISAYPYLGAARGFASTDDNLGDNSNYAYLAGTTQSARGPAVAGPNSFSTASGLPVSYESNVWRFGADNELLPSWVNTDGSTPTQDIIYVVSAAAFAFTGDVQAFIASYGNANLAAFYFVPA